MDLDYRVSGSLGSRVYLLILHTHLEAYQRLLWALHPSG